MSALTREQAIALYDSGFWKGMQALDIAEFQLHEERLCMPLEVFQVAVEKALGRSVWTHEFADPKSLIAELYRERPPRTFEEILALIPKEKLIVVALGGQS